MSDGVQITGSGTTTNTVAGNFIGTDATGTVAAPNGADGVNIANGATGNAVGGLTAAPGTGAGNVISGNQGDGLYLDSGGNVVEGNIVGLIAGGTAPLGNAGDGVFVNHGGNTIGGVTAGAGNVISGNLSNGINTGALLYAFSIQGNFIGTDRFGETAIGNRAYGIVIENDGNVTIGGAAPLARNVVSGNHDDGIILRGNLATAGNTVQGNYIGTDATGMTELGNGGAGVHIFNDPDNVVTGNLISGNLGFSMGGVYINATTSGVVGNIVAGNRIGVNVAGGALPNAGAGVLLASTPSGTLLDNTIGGDTAGQGNVIAHNSSFGVQLDGAATTGNVVLGNSIYNNTGGGIALTGGATAGATTLPVVTAIDTSGTSTTIVGSFSGAAGTTYDINFFANTAGSDGQFFLGSAVVATDSSGFADFHASWPTTSDPSQTFTTTVTLLGATGDQPSNTSPFATLTAITPTSHTPPTLAISGPADDTTGLPATFTSTISDSNSGTPNFMYTWSVTGPAGFTLSSSTDTSEPSFSFAPTVAGDYTVSLAVGDGTSVVAQSLPLTVGSVGPGAIINGLTAAIVSAGTAVDLTGTLASATGVTAASYAWTLTSAGQTVATGSGSAFDYTPTANGVYQVALTIGDSGGGVSTTSVSFTVNGGTPVASILGAPAAAHEGVPITLESGGNLTGLFGPLTYTWTVSGPAYTATTSADQSAFTFTPQAAGAYTVELQVGDSQGEASTTVTIQVDSLPPTAAIAIASGLNSAGEATVGVPVLVSGAGSTGAARATR